MIYCDSCGSTKPLIPTARLAAKCQDCGEHCSFGNPTLFEEYVKFQDEAVRDVTGKDPYDLIPAVPLHEFVKVLGFGAKKYSERNWEKGMPYTWIWGSMMRHAWAFWRGETNDKESGLHHMAHAAFGAFAFIEYMHTGKGTDDRPGVEKPRGTLGGRVGEDSCI